MKPRFKKTLFEDAHGKTPAHYLSELLLDGINVMKLATYMDQIPNEGVLTGTPLFKIKTPSIGIWVRSQGKHHLFYSYYKYRNEVCFLYLFNGVKPAGQLDEAIARVKLFYSIK